jgi:hypothetical protein
MMCCAFQWVIRFDPRRVHRTCPARRAHMKTLLAQASQHCLPTHNSSMSEMFPIPPAQAEVVRFFREIVYDHKHLRQRRIPYYK